jgi:hypothetical protein
LALSYAEKQDYIRNVLARSIYANPYSFASENEGAIRKVFGTHTARYLQEKFNIYSAIKTENDESKSRYLENEQFPKKEITPKGFVEPAEGFVRSLSRDKQEAIAKSEITTKAFVERTNEAGEQLKESQKIYNIDESDRIKEEMEGLSKGSRDRGQWEKGIIADRTPRTNYLAQTRQGRAIEA